MSTTAWVMPGILSARPRDGALQVGLPHLGAAADVQLACLRLELLARRLVAATDCSGLIAERRTGARGQVLEGLLAAGARLRLLDVAASGRALLLGSHGFSAPRERPGSVTAAHARAR